MTAGEVLNKQRLEELLNKRDITPAERKERDKLIAEDLNLVTKKLEIIAGEES